jgi:hypothetical protein
MLDGAFCNLIYSKSHAILIKSSSSTNTFVSDKIVGTTQQGLKISQDSTSKNTFSNNQMVSTGGTSTKTSEPSAEGNSVKERDL